MEEPWQRPSGSENGLLAGLPAGDYGRLQRSWATVRIAAGETIYSPREPIAQVYFLRSGTVAVVSAMEDGTSVGVATIGREGVIGISVGLGGESSPFRIVGLLPTDAVRLPAAVFRAELARNRGLRHQVQAFTLALLNQIGQGSACNRFHSVQERLARWLLMTADHAGSSRLPITHDVLAQMLGVRRATVTVAAGALQQRGLIRCARGHVAILDCAGLAEAACECYHLVATEYDLLLSAPAGPAAARSPIALGSRPRGAGRRECQGTGNSQHTERWAGYGNNHAG
jgi:CRP-like cAMP-binding protein